MTSGKVPAVWRGPGAKQLRRMRGSGVGNAEGGPGLLVPVPVPEVVFSKFWRFGNGDQG